MAKDINILRHFRDRYLMTSNIGRAFVNLYYKYSPPVAEVISKNETLKSITRTLLKPIIWGAEVFIKQNK